jgi:hypothetical protein
MWLVLGVPRFERAAVRAADPARAGGAAPDAGRPGGAVRAGRAAEAVRRQAAPVHDPPQHQGARPRPSPLVRPHLRSRRGAQRQAVSRGAWLRALQRARVPMAWSRPWPVPWNPWHGHRGIGHRPPAACSGGSWRRRRQRSARAQVQPRRRRRSSRPTRPWRRASACPCLQGWAWREACVRGVPQRGRAGLARHGPVPAGPAMVLVHACVVRRAQVRARRCAQCERAASRACPAWPVRAGSRPPRARAARDARRAPRRPSPRARRRPPRC